MIYVSGTRPLLENKIINSLTEFSIVVFISAVLECVITNPQIERIVKEK